MGKFDTLLQLWEWNPCGFLYFFQEWADMNNK